MSQIAQTPSSTDAAQTGSTNEPERDAFCFYDIESLTNLFSVSFYMPQQHSAGENSRPALYVYYLLDDPESVLGHQGLDTSALVTTIQERNPALPANTIVFPRDLSRRDHCEAFARMVGACDPDMILKPWQTGAYEKQFRPVCDTDPEYSSAKHPYLAGYNSTNYDTTMTALFLAECQVGLIAGKFSPATAAQMRLHNDRLFSDAFRDYMPGYLVDAAETRNQCWNSPQSRLRQAMLMTGRHIDVARLNEVQSRVSLKRLLGMLGHQILESDRLSGPNARVHNAEDLYELLAYNVSDCVGLSKLFEHPTYASAFELKRSLLSTYPDTRYEADGVTVRRNRLTPDTSSAKFVARILCPKGHLRDIETVSFMYPSERVAAELGIQRTNVLEDTKKFFEEAVEDPSARAAFEEVYRYYKSIEGKNFNDSATYRGDYPGGAEAITWFNIAKRPNNIAYVGSDGAPTSCFATFSTGGIHGAEADLDAFRAEQDRYARIETDLEYVRQNIPDATLFVSRAKQQFNTLLLPDGTTIDKTSVLLGSDPATVRYRKPKPDNPDQVDQLARAQAAFPDDPSGLLACPRISADPLQLVLDNGRTLSGKELLANTTMSGATYRDKPAGNKPVLFEARDDGSTRLKDRYTFTSAARAIHEDFTSYYPNLLSNMSAFYNPELGEDRYTAIFHEKERLGKEMKNPALTDAQRADLATKRNGTKLILNSASGAGDAGHDTPIRMNNQIISMRLIGQLFSWRIGQAQTLRGGRIISTNTDGLYSALGPENPHFTAQINNKVLDEQAAVINVPIEPEEMYVVSKDANARLELLPPQDEPSDDIDNWKITSASGGTLACWNGPRPDKSLAHPAVIDRALALYLRHVAANKHRFDTAAAASLHLAAIADLEATRVMALAEAESMKSHAAQSFAIPFDEQIGARLIADEAAGFDAVRVLLLFSRMVTASAGSITYPFATTSPEPEDARSQLVQLQQVNRVLFVKEGTEGALYLQNAGAWAVNPASLAKRREAQEKLAQIKDWVALDVLKHHGWAPEFTDVDDVRILPEDQDIAVRKINGVDPSWPVLICNDDLHSMTQQRREQLIEVLDLDRYTRLLAETYEKNWRNTARTIPDLAVVPAARSSSTQGQQTTQTTQTQPSRQSARPPKDVLPKGNAA